MIGLDTNAVSGLLRPASAKQFDACLSAQDGAMVNFAAVGEAEFWHGVEALPAGKRMHRAPHQGDRGHSRGRHLRSHPALRPPSRQHLYLHRRIAPCDLSPNS